jgi:hypothetical protein
VSYFAAPLIDARAGRPIQQSLEPVGTVDSHYPTRSSVHYLASTIVESDVQATDLRLRLWQ